ncbi:MAG: molybdenum ABC transporter ATP-binding protein [Rhodospirillales bacterium]
MLEMNIRHRIGDFKLEAAFTAEDGLTALFGRSGAGKTTLVNMLAGLETPVDGRIVVDGHVMFDSDKAINLAPERRRLGYVFQEARLFPHMTVRSNLTYGMRLAADREPHQDFEHIVKLLDLTPLLQRRPHTLSGGEKQRVSIGRALLAGPRLLLMDEPLASLDAARKNEIMPFIERMRDELGLPIVYVSHAMEEVIRLADTMVVLSDGRAVASGPVEEIMSRLDLHPLTGRYEAGAVLGVTLSGHDEEFDLSELSFADSRLLVPRLDLPIGTSLRVRVRARDVSLSLIPPKDISVLNIIEGVVREIDIGEGAQADVLLEVGKPLIARITRKSLHDLDLKPGTKVHALIKAIAVDRHSLGGHGTRKRPRPPS